MPIVGFEPRITGVGGDCLTSRTTDTAISAGDLGLRLV